MNMDHRRDESGAASLRGKHAVVTGASSGQGLAIARRLARAGASTTMMGRSESAIAEAAALRDEGFDARGLQVDVSNYHQLAEAYEQAASDEGKIHIAVHAAGVVRPGSVSDFDPEAWRDIIETNVLGVIYGCREALRRMGRGGYIVNVSSISGREPSANAAYCGSKFAVTGYTESLRRLVADDGIRVACLEPGMVRTQFNRHYPTEFQEARDASPALDPDEIADIVFFMVNLPDHVDIGELVVRPVSQK